MIKKTLLVIMALLLLTSVALVAKVPSMVEFGILNYYSIEDISSSEFSNYSPGIRGSVYLNKWFGLSGDVIMRAPFVKGEPFKFILSGDAVFRWATNIVEVYGAFGPAYDLEIDEKDVYLPPNIRFGVRGGFDFNITPLLSVGVEANHIIEDLSSIIDKSLEYDLKRDVFVGITLKVKL